MSVSLNNPPYIFTTKTFYYAGRQVTRLVQIAGLAGEVGRVHVSKPASHDQHEYKKYPLASGRFL